MHRKWLLPYTVILIIFALVVACGQTAPTNPTKVAVVTTKRLIINSHSIQTLVVTIDNRLYVSLEDITSALNGEVTLKGDDVIASFDAVQTKSEMHSGGGDIRGTLTYFFNTDSGDRPDTGAEIALVSGKLEVPPSVDVIMLASQITIGDKKLEAVKITTADGSGNYSIQDVPSGEYTLLLKSNHTNGATQRDIGGKILTEPLTIKAGKTLDISEDFGMTAF
jgi:hypothetical protein